MFKVICSIGVLCSSVLLTACGQSGALQLPSDPNFDTRAKYLLYKHEASSAVPSQKSDDAAIDIEQPASSPTSSQIPSP